MIQLTYISTATRNIVENSVSEILKISRLNNAAAGVTGLLLYDGRRFCRPLRVKKQASKERISGSNRIAVIVASYFCLRKR